MNEKILVVDDERELADLLEVYLKNDGYTVYKYSIDFHLDAHSFRRYGGRILCGVVCLFAHCLGRR